MRSNVPHYFIIRTILKAIAKLKNISTLYHISGISQMLNLQNLFKLKQQQQQNQLIFIKCYLLNTFLVLSLNPQNDPNMLSLFNWSLERLTSIHLHN